MHLKVLFVFLDFHHNVVDVEEFSSDGDILERFKGKELRETMVKLYHLCQDPLHVKGRGDHMAQGTGLAS